MAKKQNEDAARHDARQFSMPEVGLGWPVLWRHHKGERPVTGIVTEVHDRAVDVLIFPPGARTGIVKSAVKHADDPAQHLVQSDDGVWEHTSFGARLIEFSRETAVLPE